MKRYHLQGAAAITCLVIAGAAGFAAPQKKHAVKPVHKAKAGATSSSLVIAGEKVFTTLMCGGCHSMSGKGGNVGPDLTHVGRSKSPDYLTRAVRNNKALNPRTIMPPYPVSKVSAAQMKSLVAFLANHK